MIYYERDDLQKNNRRLCYDNLEQYTFYKYAATYCTCRHLNSEYIFALYTLSYSYSFLLLGVE